MYNKISKADARKLFITGKEFIIVPHRLRPDGWTASKVDSHTFNSANGDFDAMVNAFEYYNCSNAAGRYAAFYVEG